VVAVPARGWRLWPTLTLPRGLAAAAVLVVLALGGWNLYLQGQLSSRDAALRAVASAISGGGVARQVMDTNGSGRGYLVTGPSGHASLVAADLAPPASGGIYELWLIGSDGKPVGVGTYGGSAQAVSVVPLEQAIGSYATFAITVEAHRVEAPTTKPIMTAALNG
jgi:anti-sigma-K factor RskA